MNGLGIDPKLIENLATAPMEGRRMAREDLGGELKMGLMKEQLEQGRRMAPLQEKKALQEVEAGQMDLENRRKVQEYAKRFSKEYQSNPEQDPIALKKRIAAEIGLPGEVFKALEEGEKKFEASLRTGTDIFKFAGKKGLMRWLDENPELSKVVKITDLPEDPVRGILIKFSDGTEIKAIRDEATGKVEIIKPTEAKTLPSAGNIVDLAIKRKFGTEALQDPTKSKEADMWLDTDEGRKAVKQARDDMTSPTIGIIQTGEGIKTIGTRGEGIGQIKETGEAPPLSEDFKKDYSAVGQANDLVSSLKGTWDSLNIGSGVSGRSEGTKSYLAAKTGQNADAKLYLDNREAFLGNLSRSLAAERGVLTQQDIERIAKAIPRIGINAFNNDNKEEADKKWNSIFTLIENAEKRMGERAKMRTEKPSPIKGEGSQERRKFKIIKVE